MLQFEHVTKRYETGHEALADVNFARRGRIRLSDRSLRRGQKHVAETHYGDRDADPWQSCREWPIPRKDCSQKIPALRRQIGFVFQNHHLLFDRSVYENVALPLYIQGTEPREVARKVSAALSKVGLHHKAKHMPIGLSGVSSSASVSLVPW